MFKSAVRFCGSKMNSSSKLSTVPIVDLDDGVFKYILIKLSQKSDAGEESKNIVRGYADCKWHSDIFQKVQNTINDATIELKCLGGGKIEHQSAEKFIKLYGESQGYGKADHSVTKEILVEKFPEYCIKIDDTK